MYNYRIRLGYGSGKLLIEFVKGVEKENFLTDLKEALSPINLEFEEILELWMNNEVLFHVNSSEGKFLLSKDIWDFAFILADDNQECVKRIDQILSKSKFFIKEEVDLSKNK
ncbi:hypothetical protein [Adhaeribacter rhizoryzae]|uniref:Uncharacterized protein n=1 Tax=Adhaeribacter rhizoryzae TaxID=2607907 RepID=A0A5M6DNQ0_9BACT|nr:hypothetical protein [Adhaeribacter rhizoryzae]KAA5549053.1 hypothetical protein F0145_00160 [Adhaeribacter rhizoryzae]